MSIPRRISLGLMAFLYLFAGVTHFTTPDFFLRIMPPWLPMHLFLVHLSGVAEILLGIGLLIPKTRRWAAWGVIALLIAVFPANIHAAIEGIENAGGWPRLPFQGLLIWWAWTFTRETKPTREGSAPATG